MSRDKAMEATMRLLKPQAPAQPAEVNVENSHLLQIEQRPAPAREPEMVLVRKTVANSSARSMVYLSPAVKRKLKEIAYHEGCRENDMWLEAIRDWLAKKGHFNVG